MLYIIQIADLWGFSLTKRKWGDGPFGGFGDGDLGRGFGKAAGAGQVGGGQGTMAPCRTIVPNSASTQRNGTGRETAVLATSSALVRPVRSFFAIFQYI